MAVDSRDIPTSDNARLEPGALGGSGTLGTPGALGAPDDPEPPDRGPRFGDFTKFPLFIIAAMFVAAVIVYPSMPAVFPTHWGLSGAADAWSHKSLVSVFVQPLIALGLYGLLVFLPRLDPKRRNLLRSIGSYNLLVDAIMVFFAGIFALTTTAAFQPRLEVGGFIFAGVGLLFVVLGFVMRGVKRNTTFGVRVPWTLADEVMWDKTNALGGRLFAGAGLVTVAAAFLTPPWNAVVMMTCVLGVVAVLLVYSWVLYRSRHAEG
jgi:uncharacterized membrane protein